MPQTVAKTEVPATIRHSAATKWARFAIWTTEHFSDAKRRESQAIAFSADDGVTEENWGKVLQACRNAAKALGFRARGRFVQNEGILYVQSDGPFVARSQSATTQAPNGSTASTTGSKPSKSAAKTASGARSK